MTRLLTALLRATRDLRDLGQRWALVGGLAVSGHLIALKLLARDDRLRPQDFDDLKALLREASPEDVGQAREALQLIIERGYNRGRGDLLEQLEQIVADRSR